MTLLLGRAEEAVGAPGVAAMSQLPGRPVRSGRCASDASNGIDLGSAEPPMEEGMDEKEFSQATNTTRGRTGDPQRFFPTQPEGGRTGVRPEELAAWRSPLSTKTTLPVQ